MAYVSIIRLMMFKDQSKTKASGFSGSYTPPPLPAKYTFSQLQVGFTLKSKTPGADEEFTIRKITSSDGKPKNEDCTIDLENKAGETRTVKGSTVRSGYEFASTGDVVVEPPAVGVMPVTPLREDCEWLGVNIAGIREFYARKRGEGSRILMLDKTAYIVADTVEEVANKIAKAGGYVEGMPNETRANPASSGEAQG